MKEKTIKTDGRKFLLDAHKLIGISGRNIVRNNDDDDSNNNNNNNYIFTVPTSNEI
jgi:hypothetical protein